MQLDLSDEETFTFTLLNLLTEAIEGDRYPFSPRIRMLRDILAKFASVSFQPIFGAENLAVGKLEVDVHRGVDLKKRSRERYYRCDLTTNGIVEPPKPE